MNSDKVIKLSVLFYICSFLGFLYELIITFCYTGKIYSHGVIKGPFLPIYGFGSVLIIIFLNKYKENIIKFFCSTFFLTGIFEYLSGLFLLKVFKMRRWDYTKYFFNIDGLVCFISALCFSIGGLLIVYLIYPIIEKILKKINKKYIKLGLSIVSLLFIKDIIATLKK